MEKILDCSSDDTMRATPAPGNSSVKRPKLVSFGILVFRLLRMFIVTELILLMVILYGLYAGWSEPKQWSDAFFYAFVAQMVIAKVLIEGTRGESYDAAQVRYIVKGDINETLNQLVGIASHKVTFSLRVFIGGLLTLLIAILSMVR